MKRRQFISSSAGALASLYLLNLSCKKSTSETTTTTSEAMQPWFKLSLAQWSLNEAIRGGKMDPMDFAKVAKELGFSGLEYVNHLYAPWLEANYKDNPDEGVMALAEKLNEQAKAHDIENLIMMVDVMTDLGDADEANQEACIIEHKRWIDASEALGCKSMRINLFGNGTDEEIAERCVKNWRTLCEYAQPKNLNIVVENHGWQSSNPKWLIDVIERVDMDNAGLLPDFGNFCIKRKDGQKWGECIEEYPDYYEAIKLMMPYAKGVSAKSYKFDAEGNETKLDYGRMLNIVKEAGFTGHIGVEFEGGGDEKAGIAATRDLLLKLA